MDDTNRASGSRPQPTRAAWLLWGLGILAYLVAAGSCLVRRGADTGSLRGVEAALTLIVAGAAASTIAFFSSSPLRYRIAYGARAATLLLVLPLVAGQREAEVPLLGSFLLDTGLAFPFPRNLAVSLSLLGAATVVRLAVHIAAMGQTLLTGLWAQVDFLFLGVLAGVPVCLLTRYREAVIGLTAERHRLDELVMEMTKANIQYQDFATAAAEAATEGERLRITRDIHDVVGYTLTNNIALMEAATDMMRRNPLGIPGLLKAARENAEEGLQQIRGQLYRLREHHEQKPRGLRAIARLCDLFSRATGIRVRASYGNIKWEYGELVDYAIYHLIQEALLNSFRHGKALKVDVTLWETEDAVMVTVSDDGRSTTTLQEGIGLHGMRERIEALSGKVTIETLPGAFTVRASIPIEGRSAGG